MEPFFINPLTPAEFVFSERMPHSIAVAKRKRPFEKMRIALAEEKAYKTAVAEVEALKESVAAGAATIEAQAAEIEALKAAAEAAEIEALKAAAEAAAPKKTGK